MVELNESGRPNRTLKAVVIEPFKQIKLGAYVVAVALAFSALTTVVFVNAFYEQYQQVMEMFQVVGVGSQRELVMNDVFMQNLMRLGALLLSFILVTLGVVFHVTHKYYGPLVSIERFVEGMTNGDYSQRVVLRKGDELQSLAAGLNHMAENLQKRHGVPMDRRRSTDDKGAS